jgi:hypothetical protein
MPPVPASSSGDNGQAVETSVRQLIANGKFKTALDNAKEFHKHQRTAASEALLLDAYVARIQSLLDQNLAPEAKSLLAIVRERFPSAKERLESCTAAVSARGSDLSELLEPLNDPGLSPERRSAIEQIIQTQVTDLRALADCAALSPEHSLRRAATALDRAFEQVTSGPLTEEQIALPEVPYRSPLAAWKLLVRAIAYFHLGQDQECLECLVAIKPESAPSRLVPVMHAMLGEKKSDPRKAAEDALVSRIGGGLAELRDALAELDHAFWEDADENRIFKAVRTAVRECLRSAPDRVQELKRIVAVRGEAQGRNKPLLLEALGGAPVPDAVFLRMSAVSIECSDDDEDVPEACDRWEQFRRQAIREGWFRADGVEAATVYLHMADLLGRLKRKRLKELQQIVHSAKPPAEDVCYFLFPEKLYARACTIDPHPEVFAQWMRWAASESASRAENVAREWHRIRPDDFEPLLYLMKQAEKRHAFPNALLYLEKAERIDAVHSEVRAARPRLLAAAVLSHLKNKKPHLAAEKLVALAKLPQSQQGDRPAFLAALEYLVFKALSDEPRASEARLRTERLLGGGLAAGFLTYGLATIAKRGDFVSLSQPKALSGQERKAIPASLARVLAVAKDLGFTKFQLPVFYFAETEKQFPAASSNLSEEQILSLGELGLATFHPKLAWAASVEGLKRGGPTEARFLLLRARTLPEDGERQVILAAASIEIARFLSDFETVEQAAEVVRNPHGGSAFNLTFDQAREVVRKELKATGFPRRFSRGPDYSNLMPPPRFLCPCPDCSQERGEAPMEWPDDEDDEPEFDEAEMKRIFYEQLPEGVPPDIARELFEIAKESLLTGKSPEKIMSRVMGDDGKKKKGRRKR